MAHFNRMKILTYWRKVLRLAKTEQLKKDIQIYQQNHDREIDAKEAMVQMYDRDLDEAEEREDTLPGWREIGREDRELFAQAVRSEAEDRAGAADGCAR